MPEIIKLTSDMYLSGDDWVPFIISVRANGLASFVLQSIFDIREWGGHYWITAAVFIAVYGLLVYIDHELSKHRQSLLISLFDLLIERLPFLSSIYRVSKKVIGINTRL